MRTAASEGRTHFINPVEMSFDPRESISNQQRFRFLAQLPPRRTLNFSGVFCFGDEPFRPFSFNIFQFNERLVQTQFERNQRMGLPDKQWFVICMLSNLGSKDTEFLVMVKGMAISHPMTIKSIDDNEPRTYP